MSHFLNEDEQQQQTNIQAAIACTMNKVQYNHQMRIIGKNMIKSI